MASDRTQLHSCQFPSLGRGSVNDVKRPLSVRVELQHPELLQQLSVDVDGKNSLLATVGAAWALVLRAYTGLDQVCFGSNQVGGAESHEVGPRDSVVAHIVSDEVSIAELLRSSNEDIPAGALFDEESSRYNTSVLVRFAVQGGTTSGSSKTVSTTMAASVGLT